MFTFFGDHFVALAIGTVLCFMSVLGYVSIADQLPLFRHAKR